MKERATKGIRTSLLGVVLASAILLSCAETGRILTAVGEEAMGGAAPLGTGGMGPSNNSNIGGDQNTPSELGPTGDSMMVDGGDSHTCAVVDGALYCFGDNQNGALGLGDFEARTLATRVGTSSAWTNVGSGDGFSCGVRSGSVWCWGRGSNGQLGVGEFSSSSVPIEVTLPEPVQRLGVGHEHVCAILESGALYCWGQNTEGQLAQSDPWSGPGVNSAVPLPVAEGETWRMVTGGQGHTCAIRSDGSLWCWGRNSRGELGQGADQAGQIREPAVVGSETDFAYVSAGHNHTCAVRGGNVYCWGDNSHFQLGVDVTDFVEEPVLVSEVVDAISLSVDTFHSCAIDAKGDLFCWGRNIEGQLGDGTTTERPDPTPAVPQGDWEQISVARFHTCGVRLGAIRCTGDNSPGRLGTGDLERRREFTRTRYFPSL